MKYLLLVLCSLLSTSHASRFDLSDEDHYGHGSNHEHNTDYDHEAFLGEEAARLYDEYSEEESKERLGELFHQIDEDKDELVTIAELTKWMIDNVNRNNHKETSKQMVSHDVNKDGVVSWDEYRETAFGDKEMTDATRFLLKQKARRFKKADSKGNKTLDVSDFTAFLYPDHYMRMKDVLVNETMEEMDVDRNGFVDVTEYLSKIVDKEDEDGELSEREHFYERDINKDGKLDIQEMTAWILSQDYGDLAGAEAKHLISESDENDDGKLTMDEMIDKYDLFVGSHATEYGRALTEHTEL